MTRVLFPEAARFGRGYRYLLGERGRTQAELATLLGTPEATVSRRLGGRMRLDLDLIKAMCDFLGVTETEVYAAADRVNSRYRHVAA